MGKMIFKGKEVKQIIQKLLFAEFEPDTEYEIEIKKHYKKRSLNANAYSWTLTDKLSEKMLVAGAKLSKDEMHSEMICRYGQPEKKNGQTVVVTLLSGIKPIEFGLYAREIAQGVINSKEYTSWRVYRGSHTYNTQEMSLFIKGIIEECKEQGIEYETPEELALLEEQ